MNPNSMSPQDHDQKWPRWELLLLFLTLLSSMCGIFSSTEVALGFWPEWVSSSLLSPREADYTGGPGGSRFAVFDSQIGPEAATDIARLQITPTGDEAGRAAAMLPLPPPFTPPNSFEPTARPQSTAPVTPATPAATGSTPTAAPGSPATLAAASTPTAGATIGLTGQPSPTPAGSPGQDLPAATAPPPASPIPPPPATPLPADDDDDDDDDDGGHPLPPATPTGVSTSTPPPTQTPLSTAPPAATPTATPANTPTATPTNTPVAVQITGRVFEDVDYSGGAGMAFGGGDAGLPNVAVELYDGATLLDSTITGGTGVYTFTGLPGSGTFTVRVVSVTIGDADTPPAAGFNSGFSQALPEQTYENDGTGGNGGAGALGGNDPGLDDTATAAGMGPGDTNVPVAINGVDVTGVDFGFAFNLVANPAAAGQGSLQQAIDNANALAGTDTIVFDIAGSPPYTIRPKPGLPQITDPVVIDGTTQPGFAGAPLIEIDGSRLTGTAAGLRISAGASTVRGLVINRVEVGLELTGGGGNVIAGNFLGLDVTGDVVLANAVNIEVIGSSNNRIGGPTPAERNVLAGGSSFEIRLRDGANGNQVQGNYIGLNAAGTTALGLGTGVAIYDSAHNRIGGPTAADRNVIATGGNIGLYLTGSGAGNIIQGNYIGTDAAGTAALGNLRGVHIDDGAPNTMIGGAAAGAGNLIAYSSLQGVSVSDFGGSQGVTIRGNSIYANGGLGVDLAADGLTTNDSGDGDGGPNGRLNFPVIDQATLSSGAITVTGYARPGSIIEFFQAEPDPSGFGEGRIYLKSLTEGGAADADNTTGGYGPGPAGQDTTNRFSFTFPAGSLTTGDKLTATATDAAGNTSEFGPNVPVSPPLPVQVSGRIFEDADYSGGPGTAFGGGDVGLPQVTVELYDGSTRLDSVVTDAAGRYTFTNVPPGGAFTVRAVSATIGDADTPPAAGFNGVSPTVLAEQTYESDGVAGNGGAGALGGNDPVVDDTATAAGAGPGDANVTVTTAGSDVTGVDLGFAFNLVANPNDAGQGSLRAALANANAINGTGTLVFNLAGPPPQTIQPATALPEITDPVVIDGTTQPGFGGSPLVEIDGSRLTGSVAGLSISAGDSAVRGLVINRFGDGVGLELKTKGNNVVQGNYLGVDAAGAGALSNFEGLSIIDGSTNNLIGGTTPADRNVISGNSLANIFTESGADSNTIIGNYIGTDAAGATALDGGVGLHIQTAFNIIGGTTAAERNIISGNLGSGGVAGGRAVLLNSNAVGNIVQGNYIGLDASGLNPVANKTGVYLINGAGSNVIGGPAPGAANIIAYNSPNAGILFGSSAGENNQISRNSIFANAGLGIDINPGGVALNDDGDSDRGPNTRLNFPVIDQATIGGSVITVTGFARPNSIIEFFVADSDPSGFGEGQTYLVTLTEGAAADGDDTTGSYGPGPAGQDTTNRFSFTFPAGPLTTGDEITATATDAAGNTSEFGPNFTVN